MNEQQRETRYYHDLNQGHDDLLRCKDCHRLVLYADIKVHGMCRCGNKRFTEITALTMWEWFKIRVGWLRFPHREKFLKEFTYE